MHIDFERSRVRLRRLNDDQICESGVQQKLSLLIGDKSFADYLDIWADPVSRRESAWKLSGRFGGWKIETCSRRRGF